ncbi:uncharacterized protein N7483_010724 [Penicillium malachiteum]|uniref:uncharacterized protein n=1 Tax=Penicillium malachiteum TaxID=1324776 RepID=UPI002546C534|nr:uncharacterized protein N7483_010724 [Penicillium malachiteum]KAJ5713543.1 hypothetical protein N7483_010724 [Penicillium malachiteum]
MESSTESRKLGTGCPLCAKTDNLRRCSGCKILQYCGQDHQREHWPKHKSACSGVRRARKSLEDAKEALINHLDFKDDDPFVNHVGRFWKLDGTRPYMMGLSKLTQVIGEIEHVDAVQAELDIYMEMLRLCPGDNMGVRGSVPGTMLRLNKDQECYDFIKWFETNDDYDGKFLNLKNADIFEPVDFVRKQPVGDLSRPLCLILLKIKLLIDMLKLRNGEAGIDRLKGELARDGKSLPVELFNAFSKDARAKSVTSPAIRARDDIMNGQGFSEKIYGLKDQIDKLYDMIDAQNKHMWPAMDDPAEAFKREMTGMFSMGSEDEMRIALNETYLAWLEVPGATEFIQFKIHGKVDELL